jgi:hypothetical protein
MQEQPIVADERQDAVTRLCLTLAVIDGVILIITVIIPLLVLGEHAYMAQLMFYIWPPFIAMFISVIWFVYALQKIDPDRLLRRG